MMSVAAKRRRPEAEIWILPFSVLSRSAACALALMLAVPRRLVDEIAKRSRDEIPAELSHMAGGEIAGKADPKTGAIKPQTAVYEVIIPVQNPDLKLMPGLRGFAKIDGGTHTFGWWLWRLFNKTFNFNT